MQRDIISETASEMQDSANGIVRESVFDDIAPDNGMSWREPKRIRRLSDKQVQDHFWSGQDKEAILHGSGGKYREMFFHMEGIRKAISKVKDKLDWAFDRLQDAGSFSQYIGLIEEYAKELAQICHNSPEAENLEREKEAVYNRRYERKPVLPESKSVFADQISGVKTLMEDDSSGYVPEGGEAQPWFDEKYGWLLRDIPEAAIDEIAVSGDNGPAVEKWCRQLRFDEKIPIERAKAALKRTGGYEDEDLEKMTPFELAQNVLWLLCHQIQDYQGEAESSPDNFDDEDWLQAVRQRKSAGMYTIDEL